MTTPPMNRSTDRSADGSTDSPVPADGTERAVHFPALHRVHERGWINDPNGILHHDGRWHVYFQHNPAAPRHTDIEWGHMASTDLVTWRPEPAGPVPRPGEVDRGGCWSGVGLVDTAADGTAVPTLVYSGVDGVDSSRAPVVVARTDETLERITRSALAAPVPEGLDLEGIRDPFLFTLEGRRWAIQGAGLREGDSVVPAILLFDAADLERWEYVGPLLTGRDEVAARHVPAEIWECPQLVRIGEDWVLMVSLWFRENQVPGSITEAAYLVGALEAGPDGTPVFTPRSGGAADRGPDFYAPQAVVDPAEDRVLAWGWSWEHRTRTQQQTDDQGWAGCLTFPRVLALAGDVLVSTPAAELAALRGEDLAATGGALELPAPFRAELRLDGAATVVLRRADGGEKTLLEHEGGEATLLLDGGIAELLPRASAPSTVRLYPLAEDTVRISGGIERAWALRLP
ncbi:glycoside hydrolase family 32 protein [Brachybacterium saurashtrense]|uniref:beta-fructofuranosidase n=1 Tax=Brachybacterium saurashtrense TaxID=556288 RepID=A0A345YT03_9MICO|nr:glycoside hydrolase family 32 protein [Brachybacterium saurashtrense]AXK47055.1 glycoside hydrolase family 32 protein [Brachybacterium saurashtrense]RRR20904.1 glycoside hydrolase family 32 protein [Brachybacterium saurashtrense]